MMYQNSYKYFEYVAFFFTNDKFFLLFRAKFNLYAFLKIFDFDVYLYLKKNLILHFIKFIGNEQLENHNKSFIIFIYIHKFLLLK